MRRATGAGTWDAAALCILAVVGYALAMTMLGDYRAEASSAPAWDYPELVVAEGEAPTDETGMLLSRKDLLERETRLREELRPLDDEAARRHPLLTFRREIETFRREQAALPLHRRLDAAAAAERLAEWRDRAATASDRLTVELPGTAFQIEFDERARQYFIKPEETFLLLDDQPEKLHLTGYATARTLRLEIGEIRFDPALNDYVWNLAEQVAKARDDSANEAVRSLILPLRGRLEGLRESNDDEAGTLRIARIDPARISGPVTLLLDRAGRRYVGIEVLAGPSGQAGAPRGAPVGGPPPPADARRGIF